MMKFIWKDTSLEVRALDPYADGVSFRVSRQRNELMETEPERVECRFLKRAERKYETVAFEDMKIEPMPPDEMSEYEISGFCCVYRLKTGNKDFLDALGRMTKEYMHVVRTRLENDERDAMEIFTGQRLSDDYPESISEWHDKMRACGSAGGAGRWHPSELHPVQIAASLDLPSMWEAFICKDTEKFADHYWRENGLAGHPLSECRITHIYIGNRFCPLLFPEDRILKNILGKAKEEELAPVFVFAPMPEYMTGEFRRRLDRIYDLMNADVEFEINDPGPACMLSEKEKNITKLTLGPLLCKRKKDSRTDSERISWGNGSTSVDDPFYRDLLKRKFGITSVSYEACGYPVKVTGTGNVLHLPLYQMNTSDSCTLHALCRYGDRGAQEEIRDCPRYCDRCRVFFPDGQRSIGMFSSLFGCSMKEADDVNILNTYIDSGIGRLAVRM